MHHFSLIKLFSSFAMLGAEWVMWVLLAISVVSISLMVERWRYYRALRDDLDLLADRLNERLRADDIEGAKALLRNSPSPAALVALAGLDDIRRGAGAVEKVMGAQTARVRPRLERNLTFLGTVGNNAPFVGLFGTVIGIIQSFDALKPPAGLRGTAAAAAATAATGRIMGTIAEALVATAIGLLVAIPAVAAFNAFGRRVKSLLMSTETLSQIVLAHAHSVDSSEVDLKHLIGLLRGDGPSDRAAVVATPSIPRPEPVPHGVLTGEVVS